jgi:hypothetical protein
MVSDNKLDYPTQEGFYIVRNALAGTFNARIPVTAGAFTSAFPSIPLGIL